MSDFTNLDSTKNMSFMQKFLALATGVGLAIISVLLLGIISL